MEVKWQEIKVKKQKLQQIYDQNTIYTCSAFHWSTGFSGCFGIKFAFLENKNQKKII